MNGELKILPAALLLILCLLPAPAAAGVEDLLTLYAPAKAKDPAIGKARARLDASRADTNISFAQMLPRVEANAGINWISNISLNYGPNEISGTYTGDSYGFSARVPLFAVPNVYNLAASRATVRGADAILSGSRQDLIVNLAEAYFGLLKAQIDEVLYREEMNRLGQIHAQVTEFKNSGTGSAISVYEAKAKLDSAAADSIKATIMCKLAAQQLESIAGRQVTEIMDLGPYKSHGPEPADIDWWLDVMLKNRPTLVQARELLTQSELSRRAVNAGHLPTISASGGYSVSKGSTFLPEVETRQWTIGLNLSLPIYSGGETAARTRRALAVESEQRFVVSETREQGVQKLKQAFLNLEYSNAIMPSTLQKKVSAVIQLEATRDGRIVGTRTGIDLLNAEQGAAIAQRELAGALYDNALRQLQLKAAAGILQENDLMELNLLLVKAPARENFLLRQTDEVPK
ncbi:MAG: TolC family protein [Deltaproteobacteria bacterium]|nr:TolC family protein [Deltaproteobacteria bacterium]